MNEMSASDLNAPPSEALPLDSLYYRFEMAWQAAGISGPPPCIEDCLGDTPEPARTALLLELIARDVAHRRRRNEQPQPVVYHARFPNLDPALVVEAVAARSASPLSTTSERGGTDAGARRAHVRCPHCHNPITLNDNRSDKVLCPACGSTFHLCDSRPTCTTSPMQLLGKFQLLERVGAGAFGAVWKARDTELDRSVALKISHAGLMATAAEQERFHREARAAAQLRHPNIVTVHEVATLNGLPALVADFVQGVPLRDLLQVRRLTFREAATLAADLADALDYAHRMGVVHRDVKPANVLLERDGSGGADGVGRPLLADFGLALREEAEITMTVEGEVLGTPAYMSPEQASGKGHRVDGRSDVYSLGVVLYELLTGELPFCGSMAMILDQVLREEPHRPRRLNDKVPRDLETICLKCLRKEPARRYGSGRELADDLRRFLRGEPIKARSVGRLERAWRWCRRNPALAMAGTAVAASLLFGSAVSTYFGIDASHQAEQARANEKNAKKNETDAIKARNDLAETNEALTRTADELKRSRDELETTLARSLLQPLAVLGGDRPMSDPEWEALWELASHRRGRLGYRFVEEASRTPVTSRQLRDRAALALHAAVGLNSQRRDELESLLVARLDDPALPERQKMDVALAASGWEALSASASRRTARQLTQALKDNKDQRDWSALIQALSAVAARMEPKEAAATLNQAAATLTQAIKDNKNPRGGSGLAQVLSTLAARLEPKEAAATLNQAIKDNKDPYALSSLAQGLSAVTARMKLNEAAATLNQIIQDTKDPNALLALAQGLSALAARMEPNEAAATLNQAAVTLNLALKHTKKSYASSSLAQGLSALAARMEPNEAAATLNQTAVTLNLALKHTKKSYASSSLAQACRRWPPAWNPTPPRPR